MTTLYRIRTGLDTDYEDQDFIFDFENGYHFGAGFRSGEPAEMVIEKLYAIIKAIKDNCKPYKGFATRIQDLVK